MSESTSFIAKVRMSSVTRQINSKGEVIAEIYEMFPVYGDSPENKTWSKFTPSGNIKLNVTNPDMFGKVLPETTYFVRFDPELKVANA